MKRALLALVAAGCASAPAKPPETTRAETAAPAPAAAPPASSTSAAPQAAAAPQGTPDAPFRARAPAPTPPPEFHAPVARRLELKNGLEVFFIERRDVPLVSIDLALGSGVDTNPAGKAGLASFTLDMLDEGTQTRDATAVARAFEDLAAHYQVAPDADASHLVVTALSATLDQTLEIFADVALRPAFRDADIERVRQQRLGDIAQQLDDPASVGQNVLGRVLFGDKHPWGFPADGTPKSLRALQRKDLAAWHAGAFQPRNAALFVVGDVSEGQLLAALEKQFGGWKNGQVPRPRKLDLRQPKQRIVYVVDKPSAPQSQIWIGEMGVASNAPDVFPVRVMNNILGGSFNSRLNGNLRTEHAYSYGVFSFYDTHREGGPFVASGGVVAEKTAEALTEFVKEMDKMKSGEVSDEELADAKDGLIRAIPAFFASNEATATAFARAWTHGLPPDYYARYQDRVRAVSKADVAKAARDRLHPGTMQIVVVGPLDSIREKVAGLKLGDLQVRDAEGEAAAAAGKK